MLTLKMPSIKCPAKIIKTGTGWTNGAYQTMKNDLNYSAPSLPCIVNSKKLVLTYDVYNSKINKPGPPVKNVCDYQVDSYWPRWRGNTNNSEGKSNYIGPTEANLITNGDGNGMQESSPVIDKNGFIYVCGYENPILYCYNPDGTLKWQFDSRPYGQGDYDFQSVSPVIGCDGVIYVNGGYSYGLCACYAINPDGTLKWNRVFPGQECWNSIPIIIRDVIYCSSYGSMGSHIIGFDTNDGNIVLNLFFPDINFNTFGKSGDYVNNILYIIGYGIYDNTSNIYGINLSTSSFWTFNDPDGSWFYNNPAISGKFIYVTTYQGRILKINRFTGILVDQSAVYSSLGHCSPVIDGDYIYVGSYDGDIMKFDKNDLSMIWSINPDGYGFSQSSPIMDKNSNLYFLSYNGYLYIVDTDGNYTSYSINSQSLSTPAIGNNNLLYISTDDGLEIYGN